MNVELTSITKPVNFNYRNEIEISPESLIVYCARVSNPENQNNYNTSAKLITYLIKNKHWSPFEMVDMTVEIQTSRAIAAQILRHRSFSFQEFSQRYALAHELEEIEFRIQGEKNRQVGEEPANVDDILPEILQHQVNGLDLYKRLIAKGIAKETARFLLPLNTKTTLYMKGSIRSWIHYLELRTAPNTQKEHRLVAEAIKRIFIQNFPQISIAIGWVNED